MTEPTSARLGGWWRRVWLLAAPSLWVLGTLVVVLLAIAGGVNWLLRHEAGTAWLLARLPSLQVEGLQGALLGERWTARRVTVQVGGGLKAVVIDELDAQGVRWSWHTDQPRWLGLQFTRLTAARVTLQTGPSTKPRLLPRSIGLPLAVAARQMEVGQVQIGELPPFEQVSAIAALDTGEEAFRFDELKFDWERVRARGQLRMASRAPLSMQGRVHVRPRPIETPGGADGAGWSGEVVIDGTLGRIGLAASLKGFGRGSSRAATTGGESTLPMLDANATIEPFATWPLAALSARTQALDLATLSERLPRTRLAGEVRVRSTAANEPFVAELRADNAIPGRWDEGRLPISRVELGARARLDQRDHVDIDRLELVLSGAAGRGGAADAGRISGNGRWAGRQLELSLRLDELQPFRLDQRAPRLNASGPLSLVWSGIVVPGSAAVTAATNPANTPATAAAATSTTAPASTPAGAEPPAVTVKAELEGRMEGAAQAVTALIDIRWSAAQIELRRLRASAGTAVAEVQALLAARSAPAGGTAWSLKTEGTLADFDPRLWWPGGEGSAWRGGLHRFNGSWNFDLVAPPRPRVSPGPGAIAAHWLPWLQRLQGNGQLRLRDSALAGVAVSAELTLANRDAAATLEADIGIGGNRLRIEGQGQPAGDGSADRWRAQLQAERLAALAPLVRLAPELAAWAPRDGRAELTLQADGRWPALRVGGQLALEKVQLGELALARADSRWRFDTARDQSLDVQLELSGLTQGRQGIARARGALQGTLREHQIQLDAALPITPPRWAAGLFGLAAGDGTRARLEGDGLWTPDGSGSGGGTWRGRIQRLRAQAWNARTPDAEPATPAWLETRGLRAELHISADGGIDEVRAEAATVRIADAITLRSEAFQVDMRQATPDFAVRAQIEPFVAAPLLARLQPGIGWGGDLELAATLDLKAAARFDADVVFERRSGDLHIDDVLGRQPLGLSALRLALAAHDGRWRLTPRIVGRSVGEIGGELGLVVKPQQRWPDSAAPLDGMVEARVADLGIWSTWVPPGWRLVGSLTTRFALGGRLGAPEYTGTLEGRDLGVRNLLQGVDVRDGEVRVSLRGDRASVERFVLKGGEGQVTLEGGATFGAAPLAQLTLKAERFRVLGRVDRRLVASGSAALELARQRLKLDGSLKVDEGLFDLTRRDAPSLDEDVSIRGAGAAAQPGTGSGPPADNGEPAARPPRRDTQVALQIDLGERLAIRGRGLDAKLEGQLRLTTPDGRPTVRGIVRTLEGTYAGYGQKLEIERGQLAFSGPPENPSLDILALRPNIDVRVGVAVVGTLVNPRVRLYSDPEMSDADKLSWLVLGRPSDGLGRADTALLQRAAVALLAGEGEAPTDTLLRRLGLDDLSFRQSDGEVRETVLSLGKQLSRRWYLGYERGVNATSGTWQLIYRIAQRFTLRAQGGDENSLDLIWVWRRGERTP